MDKAIAKTGHSIKDVKAVVMGHLHLDHGGGLEFFYGTGVPIYVHELELKHAFYSVATGTDLGQLHPYAPKQTLVFFSSSKSGITSPVLLTYPVVKNPTGVYLPHYLRFDLNWQSFTGTFLELAPGLNIHHAPGHTPGLCILQVNLPQSGAWLLTSDMYHVRENWESAVPQGWLARDHDAWVRSHQMIKLLVRRTRAKVILGHDREVLAEYKLAPESYL